MCGSRAQHFIEKQNSGRQDEQPDEDDVGNLGLFHHSSGGGKPWSVTLAINSIELEMEIDTGSARTIVSWDMFDRLLGGQKLEPTTTVLRTYAGGILPLLGTCQVEVGYGDSKHQLELLVANVSGQPPILGRDWLAQIDLDWKTAFHIDRLKLEDVLEKHKGVFQGGLGTMKNLRARLQLKTGATPKFMKARPVPLIRAQTQGGRAAGKPGEGGSDRQNHDERLGDTHRCGAKEKRHQDLW